MFTMKEAIQRIKTYIRESCNGSPQRLAVDSGLHRNTLNNWDDNDWNPTASTIDAVLARIETELRELASGAKRNKKAGKPNSKTKGKKK